MSGFPEWRIGHSRYPSGSAASKNKFFWKNTEWLFSWSRLQIWIPSSDTLILAHDCSVILYEIVSQMEPQKNWKEVYTEFPIPIVPRNRRRTSQVDENRWQDGQEAADKREMFRSLPSSGLLKEGGSLITREGFGLWREVSSGLILSPQCLKGRLIPGVYETVEQVWLCTGYSACLPFLLSVRIYEHRRDSAFLAGKDLKTLEHDHM